MGEAGIGVKAVKGDQQTDPARRPEAVEGLCHMPDWADDELPIEVTQTHISTVLLGRRHVLKPAGPLLSKFSTPFRSTDSTPIPHRRGRIK